MNYSLKPVTNDFLLQTTDLLLDIRERSALTLSFDVLKQDAEPGDIVACKLAFPLVAKLEFSMLNFWEHNYGNISVNSAHVRNGFYYVEDSSWPTASFDPLNRLHLVHFLVVGDDSYAEILAQDNFTVEYAVDKA